LNAAAELRQRFGERDLHFVRVTTRAFDFKRVNEVEVDFTYVSVSAIFLCCFS